jgi:hypothetical protein
MNNDDLDLLSSIWIMASNDETHLMTYEGIRHRLSLPRDFDVKALIKRRPELFRPGASPLALDDWKGKMLQGRSLPAWLRVLSDDQERLSAIKALSIEDVFRSQFRAPRASERSPIEIIRWGLEHLERLRKAKLEEREATAKSWQVWLIFGVSVVNVIATVILKLKGN